MFNYVLIGIVIGLALMLLRRFMRNRKAAELNEQQARDFLATNAEAEGVKVSDSGLQYQLLTEGTGHVHPVIADTVKVHYHGTLLDGTVFDSSVDRGEPISFALNQVIRGWTEGLQLMVVGQKARLFIPSELAYGNRAVGGIPAGSLLIFDVELLAINA